MLGCRTTLIVWSHKWRDSLGNHCRRRLLLGIRVGRLCVSFDSEIGREIGVSVSGRQVGTREVFQLFGKYGKTLAAWIG